MTGFARLVRMEATLLVRDRALLPIVLGLPIGLLLIFGLPSASREASPQLSGFRGIDTVLPSMAVAVALGVLAFFTIPNNLGMYREKGILRRLSTTPANPAGLLAAQLLVNLALAVVAVALVIGVGVAFLDMRTPGHVPGFVAAIVLGTAALFSLGLLVAAVAPTARIAQGIGMILFFPSMFFAGLYLPKESMPRVLARIGDFTPLGAFRQTLQDAWAGVAPRPLQLLFLAGVTAALGALAARIFRWD
jgi:ABC-2 type transport system permease protein